MFTSVVIEAASRAQNTPGLVLEIMRKDSAVFPCGGDIGSVACLQYLSGGSEGHTNLNHAIQFPKAKKFQENGATTEEKEKACITCPAFAMCFPAYLEVVTAEMLKSQEANEGLTK